MVRAGEAKADRMKMPERTESRLSKKKNAVVKKMSRLWKICNIWTLVNRAKQRPNNKETLWECDKLVIRGVKYTEVR